MNGNATSLPHPSSQAEPISSDELLSRARKAKAARLMRQGLAASAAVLAGVQGMSCATDEAGAQTGNDTETRIPNVPKPGADNSGAQGQRRPDMVRYDAGGFWTEQSNCNTRGGCMDFDFILKVFVKRVDGANLDAKRVGVIFRVPAWQEGRSEMALGSYFSTNGDTEEWHVRIRLHPWMDSPMAMVFDAWYEDGLGNTYYDDNAGEFHAAVKDAWSVVHQMWAGEPEGTSVQVDGQGISGQIGLVLSDLDYDKSVELIWTDDGWAHDTVFGMGAQTNQWHWSRDYYAGYEIWQLPLDIPASNVAAFEYAIVYKHGVVNGAHTYEFWDNNGGQNFVVRP
jgi:hypothetical protein